MSKGATDGEPVVVVSPHPDDAAYSVGGLLSGHVLAGPVSGVTVFTRSHVMNYGEPPLSRALSKPLNLLSSQPRINRVRGRLKTLEVTRIRKREDANYLEAIGARRIDLDLLDAPLRGYGWSPWVSSIAAVRNDPILRVVARLFGNLIAPLVAAASPTAMRISESRGNSGRWVVLLPLGLGGHVDHLILREACSGVAQNTVRIYYEDLPYAARLSYDEIERVVRDFDSGLRPHLFNIEAYLARKVENLRLYKSQVGEKEVEQVLRHANRLGANQIPCERLWYRPLPGDCAATKFLDQEECYPSEKFSP